MGNWGKTEMGNWAMVVLAIVMVATTTMVAEGQGDSTPSCASALVPCSDYLNSTNPPASCCTPLRQTVNTQLKCLCNLLNDKSLFQSLNINMTQALELPKHCGITDTTTACRKFSASASPPSSSDVVTPPPPGVSGNGVRKLAWNGMSLWLVLLAFMVVIRDFFEL